MWHELCIRWLVGLRLPKMHVCYLAHEISTYLVSLSLCFAPIKELEGHRYLTCSLLSAHWVQNSTNITDVKLHHESIIRNLINIGCGWDVEWWIVCLGSQPQGLDLHVCSTFNWLSSFTLLSFVKWSFQEVDVCLLRDYLWKLCFPFFWYETTENYFLPLSPQDCFKTHFVW